MLKKVFYLNILLCFSCSLISMKLQKLPYSKQERDKLFKAVTKNNIQNMSNLLCTNPSLANSMGHINDSCPVISYAIKFGNLESLQCLINYGADVNKQELYGFCESPLHVALITGNPYYAYKITDDLKKAKLLIKHGASVSAKNSSGCTPLCYSIYNPNPIPIITLLLKKGAHINEHSASQRTLLHEAIYLRTTDVLKYLLQRGAYPNSQNKKGQTPLHLAAEVGDIDSTHLLLEYGADILIKDYNEQTALDLAFNANQNKYFHALEIVRLLTTIINREQLQKFKL